MLKICCNGVRALSLLHGFRRLLLYSTSSSTEKTQSLAGYLVNSLGFSDELSLSISAKLSHIRRGRGTTKACEVNLCRNADEVISFLEKFGFDQSHIRKVVCYYPRILTSRVEKTLKPQFEILQKLGLSHTELAHVTAKGEGILNCRLNLAIQNLKSIFGCDEDVARVMKRLRGVWNFVHAINNYLIDNVALLENYGISPEKIRKHILRKPTSFLRKTELFRAVLIRAERDLEIPRGSGMFLYAVELLVSANEKSMDSKFQIFKSFGWTESDVKTLIRQNPLCLFSSEVRIKKSLDFLMNELGFDPAYLASHSPLFTYSLERRIVPRHKVLQVLNKEGLMTTDYPLYNAACISESKFFDKFIQPFMDVMPSLHQLYINGIGSPTELLAQGSADPELQDDG